MLTLLLDDEAGGDGLDAARRELGMTFFHRTGETS
ncbi:hypothetical protein SCYAM73S_04390 [Streptomyces cyaneofuscatus]